jgi:hypothetical protein
VKQAMEMQAEAERRKRAQILESEGSKCSLISQFYLGLIKLHFNQALLQLISCIIFIFLYRIAMPSCHAWSFSTASFHRIFSASHIFAAT